MATKVERHLLRINADRSINVETDIPIVAGSIGVDEVLITFEEPEDWQDMSLTVTMVSSVVDTPYTVLWDGVSAFNVPWELTQEVGVIGFSVLGISSSSQTYQRGLTQSSVGLITIVTPGINVGEPPVEPTPSAYERVLAMIESLPEVENRAEAVINDLDNAFRGVAQYLPVGMGNVVTDELDGTDSELVSVSDAFKNGKLLGAKVYGKSEQFSTTGAQLLNANRSPKTSKGITISTNPVEDLGAVFVDGTATGAVNLALTADAETILAEGQYTIACDIPSVKFYVSGEGSFITPSNPHTFTVSSEGKALNLIYFNAATGDTFNNVKFYPMLNSGSTALPWEPYTGGMASPNPDYPQEIKSVTEGDIKLIGKCIWGGEQMADDIVAAVNNSSVAYKGEDENGKFVYLKASTVMSAKVFFRTKNIGTYTFIARASKITSTGVTLNIIVNRQNSTGLSIDYPSGAEGNTIYTWATVISDAILIRGYNAAGASKIYYEQSGLFEGTLTTDDFVPYSSDSLHFLPDDVEPLRSLPDGTRDILTIDANGNGVIERNVKSVVISSEILDSATDVTVGNEANARGLYNSVISLPSDVYYRLFGERYISKTPSNYAMSNYGLSDSPSKFAPATLPGVATNSGNKCLYLRTSNTFSSANDLLTTLKNTNIVIYFKLNQPTTEIIPASRMPKVPSQYLHAWLEAKDQNGEEIVTDYSIYYEKSIGALLSQIEQALDAAGYPITDYEPEDAMSVAPVLSNDANPVTDAQMAAAVTYGFTLN